LTHRNEPEIWSLAQLAGADSQTTALWAVPSVSARIQKLVSCRILEDPSGLNSGYDTLIAAGGGTLIDESKYFRATQRPQLRLIAIPSLWGSGAERSPIVVLNRAGTKAIHVEPAFLPDAVVYCSELLESVSALRALHACGDTWAHVLEAFFSPLACPEIRSNASRLMNDMLKLPLKVDAAWFEASAGACRLQASSSVGLIHGIAHVIEAPLTSGCPNGSWGHSGICSTFLLPVMSLNRQLSSKVNQLCHEYGVDFDAVMEVARQLFEPDFYRQALPKVAELWPAILRDRCTRSNVMLVRSNHLEYFEKFL
jgi:alcohol dehydrogenase class IV